MFGETKIKVGAMTLELRKDFPMASNQPEGITIKSLNLRDKKHARSACEKMAEKLGKAIDDEEHARWEDKKCRCKICGSPTRELKTTKGDPEGLRNDRQCTNPECKRKHGMTKAHFFAFHLYPVRGKKGKFIEAP